MDGSVKASGPTVTELTKGTADQLTKGLGKGASGEADKISKGVGDIFKKPR